MKYLFDGFELDLVTHELTREGSVIPIEPQVFALIELLIANKERVITKDELNERIWGGRIVSEAAVNSRIRSARQAIDDDGAQQRLIKTVRGVGFRFVGEVETEAITVTLNAQPAAAPLPTPNVDKPGIAVLPLKLLSLDTRYEPLADAIAHEVIADLSRLQWLRVISGASSLKLRGEYNDVQDSARLLSVQYVLNGTLSLFGERSEVIVELTHVETMETVWAERFESAVDELIALRTQLASGIVNSIEQRIQRQEAKLSDQIATEDLDAWTSYFRGLRHVNRFNKHDNETALHLFERAISLDPEFALAHSGLSFCHFQNAFVGYESDISLEQDKALAAAEKAFELDPLDPVVNLTVGRAKYLRGLWEESNPWFERCATISPNNALAYYNQALVSNSSGATDTTHELSEKAIVLSPIDPLKYAFLGVRALGHLGNDNFKDAAHWGEEAANAPRAHHLIDAIAAVTLSAAGEHEKARYRADRIKQRAPDFKSSQFFRSLPVSNELRSKLDTLFADLGLS